MSRRRLFTILTFVIVPSLLLITLEVMVRLINLQEEMMPRYRYSARYGHKLMPSATIGQECPPSRMYMIDQILSLSVTRIPLVWGVADGEGFSALLNNAPGTEASAVNLGVLYVVRAFRTVC